MSRTLRIILILLVGTAIIVGIVMSVRWLRPTPTDTNTNEVAGDETGQPTNAPTTNTGVPVNSNTTVNVNTAPTNTAPDQPVDDEASILRLARIVVERYGTYSNRNNFENITNLEPFMTQKLQEEQARFIDQNQNSGIDEAYYGITTSVISMELTSFTTGVSATARLQTRRVESKAQQDPTVFTQGIVVEFKNVNGNWKVSALNWQ